MFLAIFSAFSSTYDYKVLVILSFSSS